MTISDELIIRIFLEVQGQEGTVAATKAISDLDVETKGAEVSTRRFDTSQRSSLRTLNLVQNAAFRGASALAHFTGANKALSEAIMITASVADIAIGATQAWMAVSRYATAQAGVEAGAHAAKNAAMTGGLATPLILAAISAAVIGTAAIMATNTPKMALGGVVSGPTMFMAGEAGKERISVEPMDKYAGDGGDAPPVIIDGRNIRDSMRKQALVDWYAGRA